jgi:hypothetical protein
MYQNRATLIGFLAKDAEVKTTRNNASFTGSSDSSRLRQAAVGAHWPAAQRESTTDRSLHLAH